MSGATQGKPKTDALAVRCVRGGTIPENRKNAPPDRFVVTNGVIFDVQTGRNWQKSISTARTFADATSYCALLTLNGISGFRLPEVHELHTIVDERKADPALAETFGSGDHVWSKTKRSGSSDTVWTIDEFDGHTVIYGTAQTAVPRCVR